MLTLAEAASFEQLFAACTVTLGAFSVEDLRIAYNHVSLQLPPPKHVTWPDFRLFLTAHGNAEAAQRIRYAGDAEGAPGLTGSVTLAGVLHRFRRMREAHGVLTVGPASWWAFFLGSMVGARSQLPTAKLLRLSVTVRGTRTASTCTACVEAGQQ
ncbi:MAG: hypothetical protein WDW38_002100 [Sanguina aurantia]